MKIPEWSSAGDPDWEAGQLLLLDKPLHMTSYFVIEKLKRSFRRKGFKKLKIGHAGTLDPLATGLLIVCTGKMTKSLGSFQDMEKQYRGTIRLGSWTESYDLEREVQKGPDPSHIGPEEIESVRQSFLGYQEMVPPAHSAVKIGGQRAYELARKGLEPELKAKPIFISKFEMDGSSFPDLKFDIVCTKGTYIRSVAHEFGQRLHNCAHLAGLERVRIGSYTLELAWSLEGLLQKLNAEESPLSV